MKKERFKEIVNNYTSTSDDISSLKKLASDYPFSQIVHLLLANAAKKSDANEYKPSLSNAAFHTTDRGILKSLIEHNLVPSEVVSKSADKTRNKTTSTTAPLATTKKSPVDSDILIAEVLANLEKLQILKKEANLWLDEKTKAPSAKTAKVSKKTAPIAATQKRNLPLKSRQKSLKISSKKSHV